MPRRTPQPDQGVSLLHTLADSDTPLGVSLLRVSTVGQVNTDFNPEGISLPAQRKANERRAEAMNVAIVEEFVEPGVSGRRMDKRPEIQKLITYLNAHRNIKYVFVYALSRLARNSVEDAILSDKLKKMGVTLVSATENIHGGTPTDNAMHGMLAVFNQFRSEIDGADIAYKMGEKVKNGGSVGLAKIGYRNVRVTVDGREVRTIEVDPERGHLITQMFQLYATGRYGYYDIQEIITERGLRTKPTRKHPAGKISIHSIGRILSDRYYCGYVTHDGIEYPGRHQPLVSEELFDRVQHVLRSEHGGGTRHRTHKHYLKGRLWCQRCHRRLLLAKASGNGGTYLYYFCSGRQTKACDLPYLPVDGPRGVEHAVSAHWATVTLDRDFCTQISALADTIMADEQGTTTELRRQLKARITQLDGKETDLVACIGDHDPDMPLDKIKTQLRETRRELAGVRSQLDNTTTELDAGRELLGLALDMLTQPRTAYDASTDTGKAILLRTVFTTLYLDAIPEDPITATVTSHELAEPFATLTATRAAWQHHDTARGLYPQDQVEAPHGLSQSATGSSKGTVVGLTHHNTNRSVVAAGPLVDLRPLRPCVRDGKA
jgi:DNA invertase Pin-like site-specific DNA recombinase